MKIKGVILKRALRINDLTQEAAAKKLGVVRQTLSVWLKSEELNPDIVQNVLTVLGIDLTSVTGNNFVTKQPHTQPNDLNNDIRDNTQHLSGEPENPYAVTQLFEPHRAEISNLARYVIPGRTPIPVFEHAGSIDRISELLMSDTIKPTLLILKDRHEGCEMVVMHKDKAMDKLFPSGSHLGICRVHFFNEQIVPGIICIIVLKEFTITRYVHYGRNDDEFLLRSADPEIYADMYVKIGTIKELWLVKSWNNPVIVDKLMY